MTEITIRCTNCGLEFESDYGHVALDRVRHATDAEIKAGKRLEVNQ